MPRGPRLDAPDVLHHIMARGIDRGEIFTTDADRLDFLTRLGDLATEARTSVYAWCLLSNHFHLLTRTGTAPLSTVMGRLLTGHAVRFNRRHRRAGHLFQNRFKSIVVEQEPYFPVLELLGVASGRFTVDHREISSTSHRRAAVTARAWVSHTAIRHYGLTVTEVARELGVSRQSVVRGLERAQHLALDPDEKPGPFRT